MAKKRKRRVNWTAVLWLLVILNVGFGIAFSPATRVQRLRAEGVSPTDEDRIREASQLLRDQPFIRVPYWRYLEEVYRRPDVRKAELEVNPFGRALLRVQYHEPVALVSGTPPLMLTADGTLTPIADAPPELPTLRLFAQAREPGATFANPWEGRKIAEVCRRIQFAELGPSVTVEVAQTGSVSLTVNERTRIELGSPDKLTEKFDRLAQIRAQDPELIGAKIELVLMAPNEPVIRRLDSSP